MGTTILLLGAFQAVALLVAGRRGVSRSRRTLAVALVLMLPGVGVPLALLVRRMRGDGSGAEEDAPALPPRDLTRDEVLSLADQPSALDRLMSTRRE